MKFLGWLLLTLLLVAAGALGWAVATDWRFLKAPLETAASQRLGLDVEIGGFAIDLLPTPTLIAEDISAGESNGQAPLSVGKLTLVANPSALWGQGPPLTRAEIQRPVISRAALASLPSEPDDTPKGLADTIADWPIGELRVSNGRLRDLPEPSQTTRLSSLVVVKDGDRLTIEQAELESPSGGLELAGSLETGDVATGDLELSFRDIPLGDLADTPTQFEERLGLLSGTLRVGAVETAADKLDANVLVPQLGRLTLQGELRFADADAGTDFTLRLDTEDLADGAQRSLMTARGSFGGEPLKLDFSGDSLLDIRHPSRPYALDMTLTIANTEIHAGGTITQVLALGGLDLEGSIAGPDPQRLYDLFGLALPSLPPYRIAGQLDYADGQWVLEQMRGEIGDSDIGGRLVADLGGTRTRIDADLTSENLDLDDLAGLIGGAPDPNETASPAQRQAAAREEAEDDALADDPVALRQLRDFDAEVLFRATAVRTQDVPVNDLLIDMDLKKGQLSFHPVRFGVAQGDIRFDAEIDANQPKLDATVEMRIRQVHLSRLFADVEIAQASAGVLGGQGKLWLRGNSLADLLANADGGITLLMGGGQLDPLLIEAAGLDVGETLLVWLGDSQPVPLDCTYADLQVRGGIANLANAMIDTRDTLFKAEGTINLGKETLDVTLLPYPKDFSVVSAPSPLHIKGTFAEPAFDVDTGEAIARGAAAVALAAVATPVAAILPLLDPASDRESPYCNGLVGEMKKQLSEELSR